MNKNVWKRNLFTTISETERRFKIEVWLYHWSKKTYKRKTSQYKWRHTKSSPTQRYSVYIAPSPWFNQTDVSCKLVQSDSREAGSELLKKVKNIRVSAFFLCAKLYRVSPISLEVEARKWNWLSRLRLVRVSLCVLDSWDASDFSSVKGEVSGKL